MYEISATVRDFKHYIRDWSLAFSFIYPQDNIDKFLQAQETETLAKMIDYLR